MFPKKSLTLTAGLALMMLTQGFSCSTASLGEPQMSKTTKEHVAVDPTTTFLSTDRELHCTVAVNNAPDDTKVEARWIAVKAENVAPNTKIIETVTETKGGGQLDFSMSNEKDLPPGEYQVELRLNPDGAASSPPTKVVAFTVKPGAPKPAEGADHGASDSAEGGDAHEGGDDGGDGHEGGDDGGDGHEGGDNGGSEGGNAGGSEGGGH